MAVSMLQSRALSGCRAFAPARTGAKPERAVIAHGARRKDSYMLEVNVGEEDTEDNAVRLFMNCVMESKVLDQLRWRRYKETNQERIKRRTKERHEIRKLKIVEKDWGEWYGDQSDPHAFDQYFRGSNADDPEGIFVEASPADSGIFGDLVYADQQQYGGYVAGSQGGYMNEQGGYMNEQGGYMNQGQGGYMNDQGGYMTPGQGGYMTPGQGGYMNDQGGYINQGQGGYMPQQGAYVPQQGAYVSQPGAYMPPQGAYVPPPGKYYDPQQGGYVQQQAGYYTQQPGGNSPPPQ